MISAVTANIRDTGLTDTPLPKATAISRRIEQVIHLMGRNGLAGGQEIETPLHDKTWDRLMTGAGYATYGQSEECPLSLRTTEWTKISQKIIKVHDGKKGDTPHRIINEVHATNLEDNQPYTILVCHPIQKPEQNAWHAKMHALYIAKLKERIAASHDINRVVVVLGDMNTNRLPQLHPLALVVAHSGLDYIVVVAAPGTQVSATKPKIVGPTAQMDHPLVAVTFDSHPTEATMPASVATALTRARKQSRSGPKFGVNQCKMRCRLLYSVPSDGSATASIAWGRTKFKHPIPADLSTIPDGALIWFTGGSPTKAHPEGAGHVMAKDSSGSLAWSTDWKRSGYFDLAEISAVVKKWPRLKIVGWSEDIDGVRVIKAAAGKPNLPGRPVDKMNPANYRLGAVGPHVTWLGQRLIAHGFGRYYTSGPGPTFTLSDKKAVTAYQKAHGATGAGADGFPGKATLKGLAAAPPAKPPVTARRAVKAELLDRSHHNSTNLDLPVAKKAGLLGGWFKVTEGESFVDPSYPVYRKMFYDAHLPPGAYHFGRPDASKGDAREECLHFLEHAKPKRGVDLLGCLDLEDRAGVTKWGLDIDELTEWVGLWVHTYEKAIKSKPILYNVFDLKDTFGCRLWVPRYSNQMFAPKIPKPWTAYDVWQFTNGEAGNPKFLAGIGKGDFNTRRKGVTMAKLTIPAA